MKTQYNTKISLWGILLLIWAIIIFLFITLPTSTKAYNILSHFIYHVSHSYYVYQEFSKNAMDLTEVFFYFFGGLVISFLIFVLFAIITMNILGIGRRDAWNK